MVGAHASPRARARKARPLAGGDANPRPFGHGETSVVERAVGGLDWTLAVGAILLMAFSAYTLQQTTEHDVPGDPHFYVIRQAIYGVIGLAFMFALARIDYSRFRELRVGIYTVMIGSIVLVLLLGTATRGSHRWIELPFFTFQPSELGKLLLIVSLSAFALKRSRRVSERQRTARLLLLGLVPAAIVFIQPDLGTGAAYGAITLAVLFIAGIRWTHFAALGLVAAAAVTAVLVLAPALGHPVLQGYQQDRLTAFLNPSDDPRDSSYQINQALIAVGSGGKTGRGDDSTQSRNGFLPERHTDFIFAVTAERF